MIHHMSFGVRNPEQVAAVLAEITGATAVRAPTPPFPHGSWFVLAGDQNGSALEILPYTTVFDPQTPLGVRHRKRDPEAGSGHVLISSVKTREELAKLAAEAGWRFQEVETGLFKIVKLWIDDVVLVEVFAQGEAARYVEAFGPEGRSTIDSKLRALEREVGEGLSTKVPPEVLADALGPTPAA